MHCSFRYIDCIYISDCSFYMDNGRKKRKNDQEDTANIKFVRNFEHVDGNWPSHVFLNVAVSKGLFHFNSILMMVKCQVVFKQQLIFIFV